MPEYASRKPAALSALGITLCTLAAVQMLSAQTSRTQAATNVKNATSNARNQGASASTVAATANPAKQSFDDLEFKGLWHHDSLSNLTVGNEFVYTRADSVTTGDHGRFKEIDTKTHDGVLDADGNLIYDDPKHHATCNKAHIDMIAKLAVFTESVVLVLKPTADANAPAAPAPPPNGAQAGGTQPTNGAAVQPEEGAGGNVRGQQKHGVTVYCDRMEDQYRKKYIKLYGHVLFKQKYVDANGKTVEREMTAEHAEYNGKSEQMILFAPVDGHDGNGQEIHTKTNMKIGTKEGAETLDGIGLHLRMLPQEDKGDDDNGAPDAAPDTKTGADGTTNKSGAASSPPPSPKGGR